MLQLTFNPGFTLTGLRTTRSWLVFYTVFLPLLLFLELQLNTYWKNIRVIIMKKGLNLDSETGCEFQGKSHRDNCTWPRGRSSPRDYNYAMW